LAFVDKFILTLKSKTNVFCCSSEERGREENREGGGGKRIGKEGGEKAHEQNS
jgi:hypothetical protein